MYQQVTTTNIMDSDPQGRDITTSTSSQNEHSKLMSNSQRRESPTRGLALQLSIAVSSLTICGGIIASISQLISIVSRVYILIYHPISLAFQLYGLGLSIIVIFLELDATESIRSTLLFQSWTIRGLMYVFIGLFIIEVHSGLFQPSSYLYLVLLFSGPYMCLVGFIYLVMVRPRCLMMTGTCLHRFNNQPYYCL
jgi:hypothetical protein